MTHNLKTEHEARQCWCPFARSVESHGNSAVNRLSNGDIDMGAYCIASACMAWRWPLPLFEVAYTDDASTTPPGDGWVDAGAGLTMLGYQWKRLHEPDKGYCGLAGRAEP